MILILSAEWDVHVDFVISWLKEYSHSYIRINVEELVREKVYIDLKQGLICIGEKRIEKKQINAIWFRKFGFKVSRKKMEKQLIGSIPLDALNCILNEFTTLVNAIRYLFDDAYWITKPWNASVNKMDILQKAFSLDIHIPNTWVVSSKDQIKVLINEGKSLIFKSISDSHAIFDSEGYYSMFTKELTSEMVETLPLNFMPSLIQEKIPKEYEIRSFYLEGNFYSMCIFSQSNKQTEIDFRKCYILGERVREVPYQLPRRIESKLKKMLTEIDINCCSIDVIKSSLDNNYYFLEVNPTGAFGMVNEPCGYELYKLIAKTLIDKDNETVLH